MGARCRRAAGRFGKLGRAAILGCSGHCPDRAWNVGACRALRPFRQIPCGKRFRGVRERPRRAWKKHFRCARLGPYARSRWRRDSRSRCARLAWHHAGAIRRRGALCDIRPFYGQFHYAQIYFRARRGPCGSGAVRHGPAGGGALDGGQCFGACARTSARRAPQKRALAFHGRRRLFEGRQKPAYRFRLAFNRPGASRRLHQRLGMRPDVHRGWVCYAYRAYR